MKQKLRFASIFGALAIALIMFLAPTMAPVYAQTPACTNGQDCPQKGLDDINAAFPQGAKKALDVPATVRLVINWALYLSAIVAVIYIIIGGFLYMTSAGDSGQAGKGRTTLVNALIGLVIIVLSYLIVQIVYNFLTK